MISPAILTSFVTCMIMIRGSYTIIQNYVQRPLLIETNLYIRRIYSQQSYNQTSARLFSYFLFYIALNNVLKKHSQLTTIIQTIDTVSQYAVIILKSDTQHTTYHSKHLHRTFLPARHDLIINVCISNWDFWDSCVIWELNCVLCI